MQEHQFENVVTYLKEAVPTLQGIYLFGSMARGNDRSDSDVDIALLTEKPVEKIELFNLSQKLSQLLHREVDLIDLLSASTILRFQIISTAKRIYCKSEYQCAYFGMLAYSMYARFQEERHQLLDAIYQKGRIINDR